MSHDEQQALAAALRLLARRERTRKELQERLLRRGFVPEIVDAVLTKLEDAGYLSEARFAEAFLRARMRRGEAPWLAAAKARARGADEKAIAQALTEAEKDWDALAAAQSLVEKWDPTGTLRKDEAGRRRIAGRLMRRGFDAATIAAILEQGERP